MISPQYDLAPVEINRAWIDLKQTKLATSKLNQIIHADVSRLISHLFEDGMYGDFVRIIGSNEYLGKVQFLIRRIKY